MPSARLTLLLATIALLAAQSCALPSSRILGGEAAGTTQFKYIASVRLDGTHVCGGSIIDETHILTAAHCVVDKAGKPYNADSLTVRVGSTNQFSGGKILFVAAVHAHEGYTDFKNDIAVLTLSANIVWTDRIAAVDIATVAADQPAVGTAITVAGWGEQSSDETPYKLQYTTFTVATDAVCLDAFSSNDASNICLAHDVKKGSCSGDAGNGATYNNKLIGVSNFVVGACGSRYPDVFADVVYYSAWIKSIVA